MTRRRLARWSWSRSVRAIARRGRGEGGFSLIELIVVVSILGIVALSLGVAFGATAKNTVGISQRYKESHDAQIASAYLANDVQSNASLTASVCSAGGTPVINFQYGDASNTLVSYAYGSSGGENRLTRRSCGSSNTDVVLVHNGGGTPTVMCYDATKTVVSCDPAITPRPNIVKITVPEHNSANGTNDYTYSLSGSRRAYALAASPPNPSPYGVLALGSGAARITLSGSGSLNVNGPLIVNSTSAGAVQNGSSVGIHSTLFQIVSPGTCTGCVPGNTNVMPTSRPTPIPDPFAGVLQTPDEAGQPVYLDGLNHGPGVYRTKALTLNSGANTLASGVYILEAGLTASGNGTSVSGTNVLLFNGCGLNAPGGCNNTGQISQSGGAAINVGPYQTGLYAGIVIWQPIANTTDMILSGSSQASLLDGIVYRPATTGKLSIGSGSTTLKIRSIVGTNIDISGGGAVNVGPG